MSTLKSFLKSRLEQLEHRKIMIPRYVGRPGKFLGKKDFSLDDMPVIEYQIKETQAAIKAVEEFHKNKVHKKAKV